MAPTSQDLTFEEPYAKAAMFQTYFPKLFSKATPERCSPKLLPKAAPQNCVLKLLPKGAPHSKLLFKAAPPQSCSEQLLSLPRKVVSESEFPKFLKLFPKAIIFQSKCTSMLLSKPQSCSPQLLPKAALQSCYRKPRPKNKPPKIQCCYPKLPQS